MAIAVTKLLVERVWVRLVSMKVTCVSGKELQVQRSSVGFSLFFCLRDGLITEQHAPALPCVQTFDKGNVWTCAPGTKEQDRSSSMTPSHLNFRIFPNIVALKRKTLRHLNVCVDRLKRKPYVRHFSGLISSNESYVIKLFSFWIWILRRRRARRLDRT